MLDYAPESASYSTQAENFGHSYYNVSGTRKELLGFLKPFRSQFSVSAIYCSATKFGSQHVILWYQSIETMQSKLYAALRYR